MFARISHAMQVSIALKRKLEVEAAAERRRAEREEAETAKQRAAQAAVEAKERAAEAAQQALAAKQTNDRHVFRVSMGVDDVINHLPRSVTDAVSHRQLQHRLRLRLADLDVTREIAGRPVAEVVAQICREIGIPEAALPGASMASAPETAEARAERRAAQVAQAHEALALVRDRGAGRLAGRPGMDGLPPPESRHDPPSG